MLPERQSTPEADALARFIADRQKGILERAIRSLETCPIEALAAETHRLFGTLGTYQLNTAAIAVRALHDELVSGPSSSLDVDRAATTAILRRCLIDLGTPAGGEANS